MGEVHHVVDHLKLEYRGVFNIREMLSGLGRWMKENPYEKGGDYMSEQHTAHGKCIEYTYWPWKKETYPYVRLYMKVRILIYDAKKVDVLVGKKKMTLDHGRILIYLDGLLDYDHDSYWDTTPMHVFFRTLWVKFVLRNYTKMYERNLINDVHDLYEYFERMLNTYKTYRPVEKQPHFYY